MHLPEEKRLIAGMSPGKARQKFSSVSGSSEWEKHREEIMEELLSFFREEVHIHNISRIDSIIFNPSSVICYSVKSVSDYLNALKELSDSNSILYFRGHSKTTYKLQPSIMRTEAIRKAIDMAGKNDIIVLAGKGHETYQEINHVKHHYDEREIVAQIIDEKTKNLKKS